MWMEDEGIEAKYLIRDNDGKYGNVFDRMAESVGLKVVKTAYMTPNMNSHVESFIGNTRRECLNHLVFFSLGQIDHALAAWRSHYLAERPHQGRGIDNNVLDKDFVPQMFGKIECQRTLGGLFKSYYRTTDQAA